MVSNEDKCPRCGGTIHRRQRGWLERLLLVKAAYQCDFCSRRWRRLFPLSILF